MIWLLFVPAMLVLLVGVVQWWHRRKLPDSALFPELRDGGDQQ